VPNFCRRVLGIILLLCSDYDFKVFIVVQK